MRKRVLVFINYYGKNSETFITDEIEYLSNQENIDLETLHYGGGLPEKNVKGLNMPSSLLLRLIKNPTLLSFNYLKSLKYKNGQNASLGYLINFFRKNHYDTIYCHFGTNGKLIAELKALGIIPKKIKLVVRFHGLDMNFRKYPIRYYEILNKYADSILIGSSYSLEKLEKYQFDLTKVLKLPVGVKINNGSELKGSANLTEFKIVSVGRLIPLKGFMEAVEIVSGLKNKNQIEFEIIGDGEQKDILKERIKNLKLSNRVKLLGSLSHSAVLSNLNKSQIYLYSGNVDQEGRAEAQGLSNLEAMASGCIIIAFKVGGLSDYVIDGQTGYLIEPGNIAQFTEKLDWVIENYYSNEIQMVKQNARNMVNEEYNQEYLNQKLLSILLS